MKWSSDDDASWWREDGGGRMGKRDPGLLIDWSMLTHIAEILMSLAVQPNHRDSRQELN
jgi:hypothetical protein